MNLVCLDEVESSLFISGRIFPTVSEIFLEPAVYLSEIFRRPFVNFCSASVLHFLYHRSFMGGEASFSFNTDFSLADFIKIRFNSFLNIKALTE